MSAKARIFQVDAFTAHAYSGNPALVVIGAEGLPDGALGCIAKEFPHAETAFVLPATSADHDLQLRFFNARKEVPFVGHATVAAHAVLVAHCDGQPGLHRQKSGTGIIEVTRSWLSDRLRVEFRQSAPELGEPLAPADVALACEALGLAPGWMDSALPCRIAKKGGTRLLIPLAEAESLDRLTPRFDRLVDAGQRLGCDGFFVFAIDASQAELVSHSRMFCPALGIAEDPVSGNAHAMLAAYLWREKKLAEPRFQGLQGRHVGRAGRVGVTLETHGGAMQAAHISGCAVVISAGELTLP